MARTIVLQPERSKQLCCEPPMEGARWQGPLEAERTPQLLNKKAWTLFLQTEGTELAKKLKYIWKRLPWSNHQVEYSLANKLISAERP